MRTKLLLASAGVLAVISVLFVQLASDAEVFLVWWIDILLHVLGGIWVALTVSWVVHHFGWRLTLAQFAIAALFVGVAWEVFEYALGIGGSPYMGYWSDTIKDLIDDCVGACAAGLLLRNV